MIENLRKYFVILFCLSLFMINSARADDLDNGINAVKRGDYVSALKYLKNAVKEDKEDYEANYYYGLALFKTGSIDEAEKYIKIALKDDDEGVEALTCLGDIYSYKKDYKNANKYYKKALKYEPDYVPAMISQGKTLSLEGKIDDAIVVLTRAMSVDKKNPIVYVGLGDAYSNRGAFIPAIENYNKRNV